MQKDLFMKKMLTNCPVKYLEFVGKCLSCCKKILCILDMPEGVWDMNRSGLPQCFAIVGNICELCHAKMCCKIFVVVIPKEGLAGRAVPIILCV